VLFNSYYNGRATVLASDRGHLSRPTMDEVYAYGHVDRGMQALLRSINRADVDGVVQLGLQHEQQHQELILTDIKFNLGVNPLRPAVYPMTIPAGADAPPFEWLDVAGGVVWIGHDGGDFAFDNEGPRHRALLEPYRLATRPVTNAEFLEFVAAGGYADWRWWTSEGWRIVQERGWAAPLYWEREAGEWHLYTLAGSMPLDAAAPVAHVSWFEADAYARWRGCGCDRGGVGVRDLPHCRSSVTSRSRASTSRWPRRVPTATCSRCSATSGSGHRAPMRRIRAIVRSPAPSAEYNGKFMINQMVLRRFLRHAALAHPGELSQLPALMPAGNFPASALAADLWARRAHPVDVRVDADARRRSLAKTSGVD
jgi:hypothetical protein